MDRAASRKLAQALSGELRRAMERMRIPGHPRPYYLSYLVRDEQHWRIAAKYGAVLADQCERRRNGLVDLRVGSYRSDQVRDGGLHDNDKENESYSYVELPYGSDFDGVRHGLWRLTDARFREAVAELLDKRTHALTYRDPNRNLQAFERRDPVVDLRWRAFSEVDRAAWTDYVERASKSLKRFSDVKDGHVEFQAEQICRVFVNSEGSKIVECGEIWSVEAYIWLLSAQGDAFPWTIKRTVADPSELPDERALQHEIRRTVGRLRELAAAPTIRSYSGPALLEPVPAGLLVHEALGHRLEGSRLLSAGEGQTFRESVGMRILPPFLHLTDDPRMSHYAGRSLIGHYRYDDEGVPAGEAVLVRDGVLRGFLATRAGIARSHRSNGHARSRYHERPVSRMGVLVLEAEGGRRPAELKRLLIEEIRRRGAPFGIRIIEALSGETATESYDFQAFLGEVHLASKVYPDGREEWIRGVNFIGTPLNAIHSIIAAGAQPEVDNSFCGAESGFLPVTTISPALLVSELELQSKPGLRYTQYSYPMPWET